MRRTGPASGWVSVVIIAGLAVGFAIAWIQTGVL